MLKKLAVLLIVVMLLGLVSACSGATPETIVETVVVEKEGETVVETVEVEKEVVVTVEVEKEVVVTATPEAEAEAATEGDGGDGGTYRAALRAGALTGPLFTTNGHRLDATILQPLVAIKWTGADVQPLLAESWEMEEDGKVWIYNLRQGVTWHDGEPFTADDVLFSWNAYANPEVGSTWATKVSAIEGFDEFQAGEADSLSGLEKIDDYTVKVTLNKALPLWNNFTQIFLVIMPEHVLGEVPPSELNGHEYWTNRYPGIGPFIWNDYQPDQYIEVVRNEDYFLGAPKLDRIVYQIYQDIPTILNALENGEVDSMSYEGGGIPLTEVSRFEAMDNMTVLPTLDAGLPTYLQFDVSKDFLSDVRVRQAMLYAIDRQAIVDTIMLGLPRVANTQFPAEWTHPDDLNPYEYDPDKARELLAEAGWDESREVDFIYYYGDNVTADIIAAIQQYLADVGVKIVPRLLDPPSIQAVYRDGTFEMGYFANGQGLDPSVGRTIYQCGAQLAFGYCNEELEELSDMGESFTTREERAPYYQDISRILNEEVPKGYLWWVVRPLAFNNRVVGLGEHYSEWPTVLFNLPVYQEIETWYIEE